MNLQSNTEQQDNTPAKDTTAKDNKLGKFQSWHRQPPIEKNTSTDGDSTAKSSTARDMSIFPEAWREPLKKMGNEAFELLKKEIPVLQAKAKQAEELETQLKQLYNGEVPKSLAQHPRAYTLHPMYENLSTDAKLLSYEYNFYKQQLVKIKAGEQYQDLQGYDKKW
jgi:hypothetical protein